MDEAYRRLFEDKWFSLDSDEDDDNNGKDRGKTTDAKQKDAALRKAQTVRDLGALNFYHSIKR